MKFSCGVLKLLNEVKGIPFGSYRLLIAAGVTDGLTDFFNGLDLTSLLGRSLLIKNIKFIPRYLPGAGAPLHPEIQFFDETGAGNNMDLVSPNNIAGARIVSANVEGFGLNLDFRVNGQRIQIVEGAVNYLNFDNEFKDINLYFPSKLQSLYLTANELIYLDVTTGGTGTYLLQVNFDCVISPSKEYLQTILVNR